MKLKLKIPKKDISLYINILTEALEYVFIDDIKTNDRIHKVIKQLKQYENDSML